MTEDEFYSVKRLSLSLSSVKQLPISLSYKEKSSIILTVIK